MDALRVRAAAAIDLVAHGLLDSDVALAHVVWPTEEVLVASEACADQGGPKARTEEQRLRALELVDAGWSWAAAGREVGVPKTTVQTWIKKRRDGDSAIIVGMWLITDRSERRMVEQDFETREEAEARMAELIAADRSLEGVLRVESHGEPRPSG